MAAVKISIPNDSIKSEKTWQESLKSCIISNTSSELMAAVKISIPNDRIKAVFFDHDDTLVATISAKWKQHKYIAKRFYDRNLTDEEIQLHWGKPLSVLVKHLYETENIDMALSYNTATRQSFPKTLYEDTIQTLAAIRKAGCRVGVVTATTLSSLENDFRTLDISKDLFDYIQTEDDTRYHKPDSRVFTPAIEWLAALGIVPSEVVYVGDSLKDMAAAVGAGFHFIGVGTGLTSPEEFQRQGGIGISKLSEIISWIDEK